jgi:hypothetical protein
MARLQAEVLAVGRSPAALPVVNHNGTIYVVAEPGMEWALKVNVLGAARKQLYRVRLHLSLTWTSASSCCVSYAALHDAVLRLMLITTTLLATLRTSIADDKQCTAPNDCCRSRWRPERMGAVLLAP